MHPPPPPPPVTADGIWRWWLLSTDERSSSTGWLRWQMAVVVDGDGCDDGWRLSETMALISLTRTMLCGKKNCLLIFSEQWEFAICPDGFHSRQIIQCLVFVRTVLFHTFYCIFGTSLPRTTILVCKRYKES